MRKNGPSTGAADDEFFGRPFTEVDEAKADLLERLEEVMRRRGLYGSALARAIGMHRSEVTKLLRGDLERFSLERLMRALGDLDAPVRIIWVDGDRSKDDQSPLDYDAWV